MDPRIIESPVNQNRLLCESNGHVSDVTRYFFLLFPLLSFSIFHSRNLEISVKRIVFDAPLSTRAKVKLLTCIRLVNLIQTVIAEAGEYPPGSQNWQSERTRNVACCFVLPAIIACICGGNVDFFKDCNFIRGRNWECLSSNREFERFLSYR